MSCWMKFTCDVLKNVDTDIAKKAFEELGYKLDENVKSVSMSWNSGRETGYATCDAGIVVDNHSIQVGVTFRNTDNLLEIQGDFWNTGIDQQSLIQMLSQSYQKLYLIQQLELNGYTIESVNVNTKNEVEIEAYAWGA